MFQPPASNMAESSLTLVLPPHMLPRFLNLPICSTTLYFLTIRGVSGVGAVVWLHPLWLCGASELSELTSI